jgi:hypothetical protein
MNLVGMRNLKLEAYCDQSGITPANRGCHVGLHTSEATAGGAQGGDCIEPR